MIRVKLTNEMLERITSINEYRLKAGMITLPPALKSRFRKNSTKKRAYSSNKIEGNPLTEEQASEVIESDPHRRFFATGTGDPELRAGNRLFGKAVQSKDSV